MAELELMLDCNIQVTQMYYHYIYWNYTQYSLSSFDELLATVKFYTVSDKDSHDFTC